MRSGLGCVPRRTELMAHLLRFDRARSVPLRSVGDRVFDSESAATAAPPRGGRKCPFKAVRTYMFPSSTYIRTHVPICTDPYLTQLRSPSRQRDMLLSSPNRKANWHSGGYSTRSILLYLCCASLRPQRRASPRDRGYLGGSTRLVVAVPGK